MQTNESGGVGQALSAIDIQPNKRSVCSCTGNEVGIQFYLQLDPVATPNTKKIESSLKKASPAGITWRQSSNRGEVQIPGTYQTAIGLFFPEAQTGPTKRVSDVDEYVRILNRYRQALQMRLQPMIQQLKEEDIAHVQDIKVVAYGSFLMT